MHSVTGTYRLSAAQLYPRLRSSKMNSMRCYYLMANSTSTSGTHMIHINNVRGKDESKAIWTSAAWLQKTWARNVSVAMGQGASNDSRRCSKNDGSGGPLASRNCANLIDSTSIRASWSFVS